MRTGEVVGGRFIVEELLGGGGMGSIYAAVDRTTGERIALKILALSSDDAVERFHREGRFLAELSHPAVVRYVSHGSTDDRVPFLAMEWLTGEDLEQRLRRGPLRTADCATLAARVANALAFAHERGIVHRDLKPSNLFLVDGDPARTKILDFGIAKALAPTHALTRSGTMLGTVGYMAPEHAFGDVTFDPRSDLFSLGCVLFEALAGRSPFAARHAAAVFAKVLHFEPPRIGTLVDGVPSVLEQLVGRLLAKDPKTRPRTAREVLVTLEEIDWTLANTRPQSPSNESTPAEPPKQLADPRLRGAEQQFASVILLELPAAAPSNQTLPSRGAPPPLEDAIAVITRFGGEPAPIAERGLLGIFRSRGDEARDQATRAATCALALLEVASTATIVISTGTADSRRALGRAVEHAADLFADSGRSGVVKLDTVTARLVSGLFRVGTEGQLERIEAEAVDDDDVPLLGKRMPYVGRRKDLALLSATLEEAAEERVVRRVVLTGASGMGKTRLRREFVRRARRELNPLVLQAAGDVVRAGSSAALGKQLVRSAVQLREADTAEVVQRRVAEHLDQLVESRALEAGDARDVTAEFLCELLDAPVSPPSLALGIARREPGEMAERLARAFATWLAAECAQKLTLIVLDDLQWGDAATLHYLDRAIERLGNDGLMVVAFARPEALDMFPSLCAGDTQRVDLSPLGGAASVQLIRAALGSAIPDAIVEKIAAQAAGNAFYLEELVRHVAEGGDVDRALPDTVLAMAQARFERLESEARAVLRAASVFGETFWEGGVVRLLGNSCSPYLVKDWLRTLRGREVVEIHRDSRLVRQEEHAFRHALVREAAYASLSNDDRRAAHGIVAAWLEETGELDPLPIAEHWEQSEHRSRAAPHFSRAAFLSVERRDETAAQACVQRGLACEPDDGVRRALLTASAVAGLAASDWDTMITRAVEGLPLAPRGTEAWYTFVAGIVVGESFVGRIQRAPELVVELLDPALPFHRSLAVGRCLYSTILGLLASGHRSMARAAMSRMDALAPDPAASADGFSLYHQVARTWWHIWATNDLGSALHAAEAARALCTQVVDPLAQMLAWHAYAGVIRCVGPPEAMRGISEEIKAMRFGSQFEFWIMGMAVAYEVARGTPFAEVEERVKTLPRPTTPLDRSLVPYLLTHSHLIRGGFDEVERNARALLAEQVHLYRCFAEACLAFVALHRGDSATALAHTEAAMQTDTGNGIVHRSLLLLAHAEALRAAGRTPEAMAAIEAARRFVLACVSGLPDAARQDSLRCSWASARVLATAEEWLGK